MTISAAVITRPLIGLVVGAAVAVALRVPKGRIVLTIGAVAFAAAAGFWTVLVQAIDHVAPGVSWPPAFGTSGTLAWIAVAFLAADAVVEVANSMFTKRLEREDLT